MVQFQNGIRSHLAVGGPRTHILKAVPKGSENGDAVGFAIIRVYGGENGENRGIEGKESIPDETEHDVANTQTQENLDDVMNHEFCDEWVGRMMKIYEQCTKGKDHACKCSHFPCTR